MDDITWQSKSAAQRRVRMYDSCILFHVHTLSYHYKLSSFHAISQQKRSIRERTNQFYAAAGSATYLTVPPPFKSTQRVAGPRRTPTYSPSLGGGSTGVPSTPASASASSTPSSP